jgi:hypothetical protein
MKQAQKKIQNKFNLLMAKLDGVGSPCTQEKIYQIFLGRGFVYHSGKGPVNIPVSKANYVRSVRSEGKKRVCWEPKRDREGEEEGKRERMCKLTTSMVSGKKYSSNLITEFPKART